MTKVGGGNALMQLVLLEGDYASVHTTTMHPSTSED